MQEETVNIPEISSLGRPPDGQEGAGQSCESSRTPFSEGKQWQGTRGSFSQGLDERDCSREGGLPRGQWPLPPESLTGPGLQELRYDISGALTVTVARKEALLGLKHNVYELVIDDEYLESLPSISEILP